MKNNTGRFIAVAAIALGLLGPINMANAQQMTVSDYGVTADLLASEESTVSGAHLVNLRATPARNGKLLMKVNLGEKVMTDGKTYGEWTHVKYKNSDGWVLTKFLK